MSISPGSAFKWLMVIVAFGIAAVLAWGLVAGLSGTLGEPVGDQVDVPPANERIPELAVDEWRIAVLGDSLARGTGDSTGKGIGGNLETLLEKRGESVEWVLNLGVNGSKTADLEARLASAAAGSLGEANLIVVSIGANDVFSETRDSNAELREIDPETIVGRVETVISRIREVNPEGRLFMIGLYNPFPARGETKLIDGAVARWNAMLSTRLARYDGVVVPTADLFVFADRLSADRFHPSAEGYELISERIVAALGSFDRGARLQ